jgi:hypothetical protein
VLAFEETSVTVDVEEFAGDTLGVGAEKAGAFYSRTAASV